MEVYLVRHTETVCEKGICYGQSDVGIREPYDAIFESILSQLPQEAVLYSSPLQRCTILARHIQKNSKIESIIEDSRLMEMHFGDWELKSWDAIPREVLDPWMEDFVNVNVPNGESFVELDFRVREFLDNKLSKKHTKPVIIVAHSGVIRSILCKINNLPLQEAFTTQLDYGVVIKGEM
ncbi:alpha-ribazole phosphatase [Flavobacterium gilvum]|uniref:Alpha-ribazole phosphatase n=1 Tax=Flavobacterium gilvum TaxID=1492737 RepID=A0AAC9I7C7_9FLAO|nr:alpha-ribazole phosphatase [Flavobacterium gilvum]AOW11107.1 alpha-ribazole phosphatase [Flavobacterium gilvum]KFC61033.1 phosphoglycerate mutase [Flavobacterium gilvum]